MVQPIDIGVLYELLAGVARGHGLLTYAELSAAYEGATGEGHPAHGTWDAPLGRLNEILHGEGLPPLSAVVVLKETGEPGGGFWGCTPAVPERPGDAVERIAAYSRVLRAVYEAAWPEALPSHPL